MNNNNIIDENYAYAILARKLKKYRKETGMVKEELADKSKYKVNFSEEQEMLMIEFDIAIHNHSSNSTFSRGDIDIDMILENNGICGIIVTTEKYNYYLKPDVEVLKTARENQDPFNKYFNECLADIKQKRK